MPIPRIGGRWVASLALLLCAFLLWLINHPLHGVDYHDAIIYTTLALHRIDPAAFARDPFFMFGSQDRFSLFSVLYAPLIDHLGITVAAAAVLFLGGVLWCFAAQAMARSLMGNVWPAAMAVLLTAALCVNYSPNGSTFLLNEGFATARILAFPCGVLAMALMLSERFYGALISVVIACLLHPLIGIWPLIVMVLYKLPLRLRYTLCVLGSITFAFMMLSELGPFQRFDAAWERVLRDGTHDLFVNPPEGMRWRDYTVQLLTLILAAIHLDPSQPGQAAQRRLYCVVAVVAAAGFIISMLASWYWPSRIVIQAQMWRSMWLVAYIAPFAACHLLWCLQKSLKPPQGGWPWLLTAGLALVFLLQFVLIYVLLVCLLVKLIGRSTVPDALHKQRWLPWLALVLLGLSLPNFLAELSLLEGRVELPYALSVPLLAGLFLHGGYGVGAALLALVLQRYGKHAWLLIVLLIMVGVTLVHWDQRNLRDKQWEARAAFGAQDQLARLIRPGDVVLWDGRAPVNVWYELRTANYASAVQAIGMVFSREKTFELMARAQRVRAAYAYEHGEATAIQDNAAPFAFKSPQGKGIPVLCRDAKDLNWLIVSLRAVPTIDGWYEFPDPDASGAGRLYVFECSRYRASGVSS